MAKNGYVSWLDKSSLLVKLLFCIPILNIFWAVYRIIKGVTQNKPIILIAGILWIIPGAAFCWLLDLIFILINGKPILS
ncbi:MAG: hypothetical protein FWH03_00440 [Firmicutes bacterium]|nr:hypothetical protein [Bacillota bacterium]